MARTKQIAKPKKKAAETPKKTLTPSQEETNRLLSGVEEDEDIDVHTQSTVSPAKKGRGKASASSSKKTASQESTESFDLGIQESPKKKTTAAADTSAKGIKRKAPATPSAGSGRAAKRSKVYKLEDVEFQRSELEMYELMVSEKNFVPRATLLRLVKELIREIHPDFRISLTAFEMLQTVVEHEMTDLFWVANLLRTTHKQVTINQGDLQLAALIKKMRHHREGLSMHTSYDVKKILEGYKLNAKVRSEDFPLENIGDLSHAILSKERAAKRAGAETKRPKKKKSADEEEALDEEEAAVEEEQEEEVEAPKKKSTRSSKKAEKAVAASSEDEAPAEKAPKKKKASTSTITKKASTSSKKKQPESKKKSKKVSSDDELEL